MGLSVQATSIQLSRQLWPLVLPSSVKMGVGIKHFKGVQELDREGCASPGVIQLLWHTNQHQWDFPHLCRCLSISCLWPGHVSMSLVFNTPTSKLQLVCKSTFISSPVQLPCLLLTLWIVVLLTLHVAHGKCGCFEILQVQPRVSALPPYYTIVGQIQFVPGTSLILPSDLL